MVVRLLPGLAFAVACVFVAVLCNVMLEVLSPALISLVLGLVLANAGFVPASAGPGLEFAARRLLRFGIVLFGFQVAAGEVLGLGAPHLLLVLGVVAATFLGTQALGRRLACSSGFTLLLSTGFAICGVSAIAAMKGTADADDDDAALAIAFVTICGTLSIALLPLLAQMLNVHGSEFGSWVGASVHDVAQVIATASIDGEHALNAAVLVKLTRVVLLAPLIVLTSLVLNGHRRGARARVPALPAFVVGFLAAAAVRSAGLVPDGSLGFLKAATNALFAAALAGIGASVAFSKLRGAWGKPALLALFSWVIVAGVAYGGVRIVTSV